MSLSDNVVFAIVTFYKSLEALRFKLACQTIENAVKAGHAVAVVDGSPLPAVAQQFRNLGAHVFPELHKGLGPAKRQSFFHAVEISNQGGYGGVLACEAEKDLSAYVPKIMDEANYGFGIVVPSRSSAGWDSYPTFQQISESAANRVFNEVVHLTSDIDIMFGPVFFREYRSLYFLSQQPAKLGFVDQYAQHLGVMLSIAEDHSEASTVEIDFRYPAEQRAEEEGSLNDEMLEKRKQQLETLTKSYREVANRIEF